MRLAVTILWSIAALMWLPWPLALLRWVIDMTQGTPWNQSDFLVYVLGGVRPLHHWLGPWTVGSWLPFWALLSSAIVALGWRIYWLDSEGILRRPPGLIALSIILPPLAPWIMWSDARARYIEHEAELQQDVEEARERVGDRSMYRDQ